MVTSNQISLSWHVVCGAYEYEELQHYGVIKPWTYANERHRLFDSIKMPNHSKWQGPWGAEPLYINLEQDINRGQVGIVWATDSRAQEISEHIRDQMFNVAPGND